MSDQADKLLIKLGFDTTGMSEDAKQALAEAQGLAAQMSKTTQSSLGGIDGEAAGAKAGKGFIGGMSRELKFVQSMLRKFGGQWGGVVGDMLGQTVKFGRTRWANPGAENVAGRGGVDAIEGGVGQAVGTAVGAGAGVGVGTSNTVKSKLKQVIRKGFLPGASIQDRADSRVAIQQINQIDTATNGAVKSTGLLAKGWQYVTGAVLGVTGIIAGVVGAIAAIGAAFYKIGQARDKNRILEVDNKVSENLIKEIDAIKNPADRAKRIIDELGADGLDKFAVMRESVKKFNEELSKTQSWRTFGENASASTSMIGSWFSGLWRGIKNGIGWVGNFLDRARNELSGNGNTTTVTDEMTNERVRVEAQIKASENKLKDKKLAAVKEKDAADKAQLELDKAVDENKNKNLFDEELSAKYKDELIQLENVRKSMIEQHKPKSELVKLEIDYVNLLTKSEELTKKIAEDNKKRVEELSAAKDKAMEADLTPRGLLGSKQVNEDKARKALEDAKAIKTSEKDLGELEKKLVDATAEREEASRKINESDIKAGEKKIENQEKLNKLKEENADTKTKIDRENKSIEDKKHDEIAWGQDKLAGLRLRGDRQEGAWKPEEITGPWTRTGVANVLKARQLTNAEGWAKRYSLEGYTDKAKAIMENVREARKKLNILPTSEKEFAQAQLDELADLNKKFKTGEALVKVAMAK